MNRKVNIDRPEPDYSEIAAGKDFSSLLQQATAAKTAAFYTTKWFMGGVAAITGITLMVIGYLQFGTLSSKELTTASAPTSAFTKLSVATMPNGMEHTHNEIYTAELLNCTTDVSPCKVEVIVEKDIEEIASVAPTTPSSNRNRKKAPTKPILANKNRFRFDIEVEAKEFPEVAAYKGTYFEVLPSNNEFSSDYFDVLWDDVKVERSQTGKQHAVVLVRDNEEVRIAVQPVLGQADYQKALEIYQRKLASYQQ